MSLLFKMLPKKNPQDVNAKEKYYAKAKPRGKKTLKGMSKNIARNTTMGVGDTYGVLMSLEEEVKQALRDGFVVELGDLCIFYPAVQSEGVENPDEFKVNVHIKKKSVKIRPKQSLVQSIQDVSLEKVD